MKLPSSPGTNALVAFALMSFGGAALMDRMGSDEGVEAWLWMLWLFGWLLLQIPGLKEARVLSSSLRNLFFVNICFMLLGFLSFLLSMFGR